LDQEPNKPPLLNYQSPIARPRWSGWNWLRRLNAGEDSFLACSALLFAVLCWATSLLGWLLGAGAFTACGGVLLMVVSVALALLSFFERQTSRTFALVSLMLGALYAAALVGVAWRR
jgi:hypothetical protein